MATTGPDDPTGEPDAVAFEITWTVTDSYAATFTAGELWQ